MYSCNNWNWVKGKWLYSGTFASLAVCRSSEALNLCVIICSNMKYDFCFSKKRLFLSRNFTWSKKQITHWMIEDKHKIKITYSKITWNSYFCTYSIRIMVQHILGTFCHEPNKSIVHTLFAKQANRQNLQLSFFLSCSSQQYKDQYNDQTAVMLGLWAWIKLDLKVLCTQ